MTWTLRLYDANGVEIAWVTANPYTYQITHPDPGWEGVKVSLEGHESGEEALPGEAVVEDGFSIRFDNVEYHDDTPKSHLEWVRDNVKWSPEVDSVSLADE